jgi:hypothetical protein
MPFVESKKLVGNEELTVLTIRVSSRSLECFCYSWICFLYHFVVSIPKPTKVV